MLITFDAAPADPIPSRPAPLTESGRAADGKWRLRDDDFGSPPAQFKGVICTGGGTDELMVEVE
jgi:hypothetical protein